MSNKAKAVNLTEDEIEELISSKAKKLTKDYVPFTAKDTTESTDTIIARHNYLNRRLKSFKEPETEVKSNNSAAGWGTNNG